MFNFFKNRKKKSSYTSYKEIFKLAEEAGRYARQQIVKGSSQPKNNDLEKEYFNALKKSVEQIRDLSVEALKDNLQLDANKLISYYESVISTTSKYSLGNCAELAFQAFDYILYATEDMDSQVYAEIYGVEGPYGDHAVMILNRPRHSDPSDPKTWGNETVICDPWTGIVYNALKYQSKLKTSYLENHENIIEDFNFKTHSLEPLSNFNTEYFQKYRTIEALQLNFKKYCDALIELLEKDKNELAENKSLSEEINQYIVNINDKIKNTKISDGGYRTVKKQLSKVLDEVFDIYAKASQIKVSQKIQNKI